jgi:hypothetical protein
VASHHLYRSFTLWHNRITMLLVDRLRNNDPELTSLGLVRAVQLGGSSNIPAFLEALQSNHTVETLILGVAVYDNRHPRSLSAVHARALLQSFGSMPLKNLVIQGGEPHGDIKTPLLMPLLTPQMVQIQWKNCLRLASAVDASILSAAFQDHANLKSLEISGLKAYGHVHGEPPRLDALIQTLGTVPTLEYLKINGHRSLHYTYHHPLLSGDAMVALCRLSNLKGVELSNLPLEKQGGVELIVSLLSNQNLRYLVINDHAVGQEVVMSDETFEERVRPLLESNYTIQNLELMGSRGEQQAVMNMYLKLNRAGRHVMKEANTLEWTYLMDRVRDDQSALFYILRELPELCAMPSVVLEDPNAATTSSPPVTTSSPRPPQSPPVSVFNNVPLVIRLETNDPTLTCLGLVRSVQLGGADSIPRFLQGLRNNHTVETLVLSGAIYDGRYRRSLPANQGRELLQSFGSMPLKSLTIQGGGPHGDITTPLLMPLVTPQMVVLQWSSCVRLVSANDASSLGAAFQEHANLKSLDISGLKVYGHVDGEAPRLDPLVQALGTVPTLEYLKVNGDRALHYSYHHPLLSGESLAALSRMPNLKSLELSDLPLESEGAGVETIVALLSMQSLKYLVIKNHVVAGQFAMSEEIFHVKVRPLLDSNYTIQNLELSVSQDQQDVIDLYLTLNRAGRHVMKESNTLEWIYLMDRVREDPSALFYILRELPDLCSAPNVNQE